MLTVVDTETTGLEEKDRVVEMAAVTVTREGGVTSTWSSLFSSDVPVEPEARAAHHIRDDDLRDAPSPELLPVLDILGSGIVAAHNLAFDAKMIEQTWGCKISERRICTWKCARHLWKGMPSYSNQALRYRLDLIVPGADGLPSHRALADALVTTAILQRMLIDNTPEDLMRLTAEPVLMTLVPFGKYRGQTWESMDTGYLRWVLDPRREFDEDTLHTARHWLESRR